MNAPLWTSEQLAQRLGAELRGPGDVPLSRLDSLEDADALAVSFVREARHAPRWAASRCGAVLVSRRAYQEAAAVFDDGAAAGRTVLMVPDADLAMIDLLAELGASLAPPPPTPGPVSVDPTARIHPGAVLGAFCTVGPGCEVAPGAILHARVSLGASVRIGPGTVLHPGVVVQDRSVIGAGCTLHPGVVIGADGFGYRPAPGGKGILKIPHIGNVVIEDAVEIGANTTIDRAKFGSTRVGAMTKIDNLVQVGHNCRIGRACLICGCCALAGSATLEDGVTLAGGVGVADGRTIGRGATVGGRSGVMDDIPAGETWVGYPARPARQTMRLVATLDQLPDTLRKARKLLGMENDS
ncbi:MAG: UDP-3-O-(3-hydroxymyristoyl)glucosamine N-acyltransferase [Planctomycetes bacterium]|nr:UDP-3-O-(3-hydroxymyristoyl)glucosamine N-acyltransferase [Planctomycetota bacterium]